MNLLTKPMVPVLLFLIICLLILAVSRHVSRVLCITFATLSLLLVNNRVLIPVTTLWFVVDIITTVIIYALYIFVQTRIKYDFSKKIISIRYFVNYFLSLFENKKDERLIGRVLPYNNYQLKYSGKMISMSEIASAGATLISGSIGSGKTYGMISLIKQNIKDGKSVIFTEYKGDPKIISDLETFARNNNFKVFKLESGISDFNYDPLQNLNNVGRIEAIMNMRKWDISGSDAHYKTGTQLLLQKLVGDFSHIYDKNSSYTYSFYEYIKSYHPDRNEWDSYSTVSKLMELLLTSTLAPMFKGENEKTLDLRTIKNEKFLVLISFVSSNKELATSFSSLLFRDLLDECTVEAPINNIYLYMDETGTLENPFIIKDLLEKGRSGKIATTLALQDINQIVVQTNEAYLFSLLGIINNFIIYSGCSRQTAEKFAGVQLHDIESVLMNLRKPINGKKPTAMYISKYPSLNKQTNSEVFRFEPYILKDNNSINNNINNNNRSNNKDENIEYNSNPVIDDALSNDKNDEVDVDYNDFI